MTIEDYKTPLEREWAEQDAAREAAKQKGRAVAAEIEGLCGDLENILGKKTQTPALLLRQAHILDHLFLRFSQECAGKLFGNDDDYKFAAMTLRTQELCVTALKTRGALQYMRALTAAKRDETPALPPPPGTVRSESKNP